ncbi:MAG TPA: GAF domain-containing protein [Rhizomicrobium sp.]|jgi:GAF domain-containing protein|nr:GAF domain-containing protein [Rhizomicrobium sp.]
MAEELHLPANATREETYAAVLPQIESVMAGVDDLVANLANVAAILKQAFDFHWVGFYRTTAPGLLTLGPFQGPLACVTIPFDRGVCGAAATTQETVIVEDVDRFPGHIACSSLSKSEIVVPLVADGETKLVLDIDSDRVADFDASDRRWLERIVALIGRQHFS